MHALHTYIHTYIHAHIYTSRPSTQLLNRAHSEDLWVFLATKNWSKANVHLSAKEVIMMHMYMCVCMYVCMYTFYTCIHFIHVCRRTPQCKGGYNDAHVHVCM
jgi:hypothetical protein